MTKHLFSKILFAGVIGVTGLALGTIDGEAASYQDMKKHVESGEGLVYNPISMEVMDKEKSMDYIEYIEEAQEPSSNGEVSDEIQMAAFNETKTPDSMRLENGNPLPKIRPRGAYVPTTIKYIDNLSKPYESDRFSGSGWRFSGTQFAFKNVTANPYFGVRAYLDTFTYFDGMYDRFVPISNNFVYYLSHFRGSPLAGYFATWNPVNGSRYYIY